jgi:hypothetical protein
MRQDLTTPAQVRTMIAILGNLGLTPDAVVLDDYTIAQLGRPADAVTALAEQPEDKAQPFGLKFGNVVSEVSELFKILTRKDLGDNPEFIALWLVRQVKPDVETIDQLRAVVLGADALRKPYIAALAAILKG